MEVVGPGVLEIQIEDGRYLRDIRIHLVRLLAIFLDFFTLDAKFFLVDWVFGLRQHFYVHVLNYLFIDLRLTCIFCLLNVEQIQRECWKLAVFLKLW